MARVIDIRIEEKYRAEKALADARRNLHIAHQLVETAKIEAADAATAAGKLETSGKMLQTALGAATMRADQERLTIELEDNKREQRVANADTVAKADAQTEAEQQEADLTATVETAQRAAAEATTAYDEASKQQELFASWQAALAAKATTDAIKDAETLEDKNVDYTKARDRLTRMLAGADMLDLYRQRATFASKAESQSVILERDAIVAAAEARTRSEPLTANRLRTAAILAAAIDHLHDAAEAAISRQSTARKVFAMLAGRDASSEDQEPLKSELARIANRAKLAQELEAPAKEQQLYNALEQAQSARRELVNATAIAVAQHLVPAAENGPGAPAEPDGAEKAAADKAALDKAAADKAFDQAAADKAAADKAAAEAAAEKAAADKAAADEAVAEAENWLNKPVPMPDQPKIEASAKAALDDYELAIPPELLADVIAFIDAEAAIDSVKAVDIAKLQEEFNKAEAAYATAEQADVRERRTVSAADAQAESRRRRRTASVGTSAAHKLLIIRGDR